MFLGFHLNKLLLFNDFDTSVGFLFMIDSNLRLGLALLCPDVQNWISPVLEFASIRFLQYLVIRLISFVEDW